jgi:hypothetical protein
MRGCARNAAPSRLGAADTIRRALVDRERPLFWLAGKGPPFTVTQNREGAGTTPVVNPIEPERVSRRARCAVERSGRPGETMVPRPVPQPELINFTSMVAPSTTMIRANVAR